MQIGRYEELASPDHRLDPYRTRIANLVSDGKAVATFLTEVSTAWTHGSGHLWWKRWVEAREVIFWEFTRTADCALPQWGDGLSDPAAELLDELEAGVFLYKGVTYEVVLLDGADAYAAWAIHTSGTGTSV